MKRRTLALGAVAATAATALLFGGVLPPENAAAPAAAATAARVSPTAGTEALVVSLQRAVERAPRDASALTRLGLAYGQRFRETTDAAYLARSQSALTRAAALSPRDPRPLEGLGSVALSRHDFSRALVLGRRALRLDPRSDAALAVSGDALVELGRYREAFRAFDRMAALEPGVASYARIAYGRELIGRIRPALAAMQLAVDSAGTQAEAQAWSRVELGKLLFRIGRLDAAERAHRAALAVFPGYLPALDALARVEMARGRPAAALRLSRRAASAMPVPQYVATLTELLRGAGLAAEAREQHAVVYATARLLAAAGVRTDLEIAAYDVDHGLRLEQALSAARRAHRARPSIEADDVLGWALVRNGRCAEGLRYATRALRLGTQDPVKFFHRAMAERCVGNAAAARTWFRRALALNPRFSPVWAPVARRYAS
jgi:tetratricopeptide (TPR) repeat protein